MYLNHRPDYCLLPFLRREGEGVLIPQSLTTDLITTDYHFSEEGVLIHRSPATDLITADYLFLEDGVLIDFSIWAFDFENLISKQNEKIYENKEIIFEWTPLGSL